jgi:hypothetical protein
MTDCYYYPYAYWKWRSEHTPPRWSQWYESTQNLVIENIVIEEGVTSIGAWAFSGVNGRKLSVYIPDSVKEIRSYAFKKCSQIFVVRLPEHLMEKKDEIFAKHPDELAGNTDM